MRGKIQYFTKVFLTIIIAMISCGYAGGSEQRKLSILVREGLEAQGLTRVAEEWGRLRAVEVTVETLGRGGYEQVARENLSSTSPSYDVIFFPGTLVAEMAEKSALSPIENWSAEDDPDLMGFSSFNGRVYGLPCDISTFFTFFRTDVVKSVPQTWEELLQEAEKWASATNPASPTTFGFAFAGKSGEELPKIFYPILWSYGGYIIENGRIGIDSNEAVNAAVMFRRLANSPAAPRVITNWEIIRILDELQAGSIALTTPQWNALYPIIKDSSSDIAKKIDIAEIPGVPQSDGSTKRVNFKHTWVLVKPAKVQQPKLANDFILYAVGIEGARLYADTGNGNPARRSVLSDPAFQRKRPEFRLMLKELERSRAEPEVPYYAALHKIMNTALETILSGKNSPQEALKHAADDLRTLIRNRASNSAPRP